MGIDWNELTLNSDKWRALVKMVMNFKTIHFVTFLISKNTVHYTV